MVIGVFLILLLIIIRIIWHWCSSWIVSPISLPPPPPCNSYCFTVTTLLGGRRLTGSQLAFPLSTGLINRKWESQIEVCRFWPCRISVPSMCSEIGEINPHILMGEIAQCQCQKDLPGHNCLPSVTIDGTEGPETPEGDSVLEYVRFQCQPEPSPFVYFWGTMNSEHNMGPPFTCNGPLLETVLATS